MMQKTGGRRDETIDFLSSQSISKIDWGKLIGRELFYFVCTIPLLGSQSSTSCDHDFLIGKKKEKKKRNIILIIDASFSGNTP